MKKMAATSPILSFLILLTFFSVVLSETCTYSIGIKTGTKSSAGTDATVSLKLSTMEDPAINIPNIEDYGQMGSGYDYFENGHYDLFSYTGPCFPIPICYIKLSHDNSGYKPGWYVSYVDVTTNGGTVNPRQIRFTIEQWLATDEKPYLLYTSRDLCADSYNNKQTSTFGIESVLNATTI